MVSLESKVQLAGEPTMSETDDGLLGVDEHLGQRPGGGRRLEGRVDLFDGDLASQDAREVGDRAVLDRYTQRRAVEAALHVGQHQARRLGGAGARRHDVDGGGPRSAHVLVDQVEEVLVVGVGVHSRHEALFDPEGVVEDLDHGYEAVRRAACVGDDPVNGGVEGVVVDTHHEGAVDIGRRGGDDDPLGAGVDVGDCLFAVGEDAGRLDHDVDAQLTPGERLGSLSENTLKLCGPTAIVSSETLTSSLSGPKVESYLSRWALPAGAARSLTATSSMSAPLASAARKKLRPIRPKPLIPTRTAIAFSSSSSFERDLQAKRV